MKRFSGIFLLVMLLGAGVLLAQDTASGPDLFDGELAFQHVADQVEVGPRPTASTGIFEAGDLILNYLEDLGWTVSEDWHLLDFGPRDELSEAALQNLADWNPVELGAGVGAQLAGVMGDADTQVSYDHVIIPVRNLVASFGSGPTIILGAHYDSRIFADQDPDASLHREPMPAANDGGSGVGILLELARVISENYTANNEIRLVFFDAEDNGRIEPFNTLFAGTSGYLAGSILYANNLDLRNENIQSMILVDLVGEADGQRFPIEGYSSQFAPDIANQLWTIAGELGYGEQFPQEVRGSITDDHVPFLNRGIPAVDIIDLEYPHWHTTGDTLDKVSADSLERVGKVLQAYLEQSGAITPTA